MDDPIYCNMSLLLQFTANSCSEKLKENFVFQISTCIPQDSFCRRIAEVDAESLDNCPMQMLH